MGGYFTVEFSATFLGKNIVSLYITAFFNAWYRFKYIVMYRIFHTTLFETHKCVRLLSSRSYTDKTLVIRHGTSADASEVLALYKKVASAYPDRLTQQLDELTLSYIQDELEQARLRGLALLMFEDDQLLGLIKGYTSQYRRQAHVIANGTVMLDPTAVGQRLGCKLGEKYLNTIQMSMRHIHLMEAVPHCLSAQSIGLTERFGFKRCATIPKKIHYTDGSFGNQIVLQWTNPQFCQESLLRYHEYLHSLANRVPNTSLKQLE